MTTGLAAFGRRHVLARKVSATPTPVEPGVGLAFSRSHAPGARHTRGVRNRGRAARTGASMATYINDAMTIVIIK